MGNFLIRCPVAAKIALVTAGTMGGVLPSPTPPGRRALEMIEVSTSGAFLIVRRG